MGRTACTEPQCLYKGDLYIYIYILPQVERHYKEKFVFESETLAYIETE
jgi:hypothetical protein